MTDEEIQIICEQRQVDPPSWAQLHALADEALRRGQEVARLRRDLERIASGDDIEWDRLRERIARLETALRFYADATHRDNGQRARAALEETP